MENAILKRFLRYVSINTQSDENNPDCPSSPSQRFFAELLRDELLAMGVSDAEVDEHCYVYASIPSNMGEKEVPTIGFISHLDTSPDLTADGVRPRVVRGYDGKDIVLDKEAGIVLSPKDSPELLNCIGMDIVVTDGHTLLGADDKAGIAEIMMAVEYLMKHPELPHGKVSIAFTPDEEIGRGANHFDVSRFGAEWAYTVDGGELGELEYENFNAAMAQLIFMGRSVHPGYAKGKMRNAQELALQFAAMMPPKETPSCTEGYEGFFHLLTMKGNVEQAELRYIIRDFTEEGFAERKALIHSFTERINEQYGARVAEVNIKDQYFNMKEQILPRMHIVDIADAAMREAGVTPLHSPIRGGTDGATLSFKGLPCPNLFTGGVNFHGRYEFVPVQSMELSVKTILNIIKRTAQL